MKSYEAIGRSVKGKTVEFAKRLGLSASMLHKWQEPSTDYTDSGAYNSLDRIEAIIEKSLAYGNSPEDAFAPLYYLAEKFKHIVIPLTKTNGEMADLSKSLLKTIEEFSHLTREVSQAMQDDRITRQECVAIDREAWHLIRQVALFMERIKEAVK
jgi:transcriptional regulator with XRE-family HTH domain